MRFIHSLMFLTLLAAAIVVVAALTTWWVLFALMPLMMMACFMPMMTMIARKSSGPRTVDRWSCCASARSPHGGRS